MTRFLNDVGLAYFWSKIKSYTDTSINNTITTVGNYTINGYEIKTNPVLSKSDIGLSNVTNDAQVKRSEMGVANGVATLDSSGLVPAAQLPSYVDDVLEYASVSAFPQTGETGKIYVALDSNLTYRWSGSTYIEVSKSLALGETSSTAYAGDKGAANRAAINSLPSTLISSISRGNIGANDITINVQSITKSGLNYGSPSAVNFTIPSATTTQAGLMSSSDKNKLNSIEAGAEVNDHLVIQNAVGDTDGDYSLLGAYTAGNTGAETNAVNKMKGITYNPKYSMLKIEESGSNPGTVYLHGAGDYSSCTMRLTGSNIDAKEGENLILRIHVGDGAVFNWNGGAPITSNRGFATPDGTEEQLLAADGSIATPLTQTDIDSICV